MIWEVTKPTAAPMSNPAPTMVMNLRPNPPAVTWAPATNPRLSVKKTMAVPSLSRLSPSSRTESRLGACRFLKIATTAMGSVAETSAPKTKA